MASAFEDFLGKKWGEALLAWAKTSLAGKVDKITGKGLSTNDLTTELKKVYDGAVTDVANLKKVGAEKNVIVGIKVNGTAQTPDSSRNVDIVVPTDSDIGEKVESYGYQTAAQVNAAIMGKGFQTSEQVEAAIRESMSGITEIDIQVVESLPATGKKGVFYLVPHTHGTNDTHDEYVWVPSKNKYEKIGNTDIDLSGYVKKTDIVVLTDKDFEAMITA